MPDRLDFGELHEIAAEASRHARPVDPAEVRRRGTVRRRRRIAAISGSAVLATVVAAGVGYGAVDTTSNRGLGPADRTTVSPSASPSSSDPTASPSKSPTPSGEWPQKIPADFPIATRLPDYGSEGSQVGPGQGVPFTDLTVCNTNVWPGFDTSDDLSVHYSAPEYAHYRDLVLYADEATAMDAFENIVTTTSQCRREESPDGEFFSLWDVETEPEQGDLRGAWVTRTGGDRRFGVGLGLSLYHVVQQGNAVLLLYSSGEADPKAPGAVERARSQLAAQTDQVIEELCVFSEDGCSK